MLVAPGSTPGAVRAKALTHATAKWPWLARRVRDAAGPGWHVVRLSYGRIGDFNSWDVGVERDLSQRGFFAQGDASDSPAGSTCDRPRAIGAAAAHLSAITCAVRWVDM